MNGVCAGGGVAARPHSGQGSPLFSGSGGHRRRPNVAQMPRAKSQGARQRPPAADHHVTSQAAASGHAPGGMTSRKLMRGVSQASSTESDAATAAGAAVGPGEAEITNGFCGGLGDVWYDTSDLVLSVILCVAPG